MTLQAPRRRRKQEVGTWQPPPGPVPVPPGGPASDEDVQRAKEAAKAWDDPAVQAMIREMEQRRKEIQRRQQQQQKGAQEE